MPSKCPQCKEDALLISGAITSAKDHFRFPVKAVIESRGLIFSDKVAVIYNKKTGEAVAEVTMEDSGIIFETREAVLRDKTNLTISKTREGYEGILSSKRVGDTYTANDHLKTHRTRTITKGIIIPKKVQESENLKTGRKTKTKKATKGIFEKCQDIGYPKVSRHRLP